MAQAPDAGGGGAPRQNKTVKQFAGMNTQNQRNAVPEGQFPWLENIQPIGPGNLHSIPGRGLSVTRIPPLAPAACPDSAPGAQELPLVCCYDSLAFGDLTSNAGMFAHADDDGDFWHSASQPSGFASGPYPIATPTQTWYLLAPIDPSDISSPFNCGLQEVPALPLPGGRTADFRATQTPQAGTCGKSDEKCYKVSLLNISPPVVIGGGGGGSLTEDVDLYAGSESGASLLSFYTGAGHAGAVQNTWCKFGSHLYTYGNAGGFGTAWVLASFPIPSPGGTIQDAQVAMNLVLNGWDDATFVPAEDIYMIHATQGFLYILAHGPWDGGAEQTRLFKVNRASMTYVTHWVLDGDPNFPNPFGIHAFSDDLIFLVGPDLAGSPATDWAIGNFHTATGTTDVIDGEILSNSCTPAGSSVGPPGQSGFYYAMNYFYLSYSGFGFGITNVAKLGPLVCPSNPTVPWQS